MAPHFAFIVPKSSPSKCRKLSPRLFCVCCSLSSNHALRRRDCREIMPKYFKMGSYASFQRQLNLYSKCCINPVVMLHLAIHPPIDTLFPVRLADFTRIAEGPERGSYYHELFIQGKPLLSTTMKRKEVKKPAPKAALATVSPALNAAE